MKHVCHSTESVETQTQLRVRPNLINIQKPRWDINIAPRTEHQLLPHMWRSQPPIREKELIEELTFDVAENFIFHFDDPITQQQTIGDTLPNQSSPHMSHSPPQEKKCPVPDNPPPLPPFTKALWANNEQSSATKSARQPSFKDLGIISHRHSLKRHPRERSWKWYVTHTTVGKSWVGVKTRDSNITLFCASMDPRRCSTQWGNEKLKQGVYRTFNIYTAPTSELYKLTRVVKIKEKRRAHTQTESNTGLSQK